MEDCPRIADHGLIGDLQTSALVSTDGSGQPLRPTDRCR